MLRRTRISSIPDTSRLSQAVQRPGIDPRIWCSLAIASSASEIDADFGEFVEVQLLPSGDSVNCYVGSAYAGASFGEHQQKILKEDMLCVLIPSGDPSEGGVVVSRLHNQQDKPSQLAIDNPRDYARQQEKDTSWRLVLTGAGQWLFEGEDEVHFKSAKKATHEAETFIAKTGNVRLGDESATEPVLLGNTYRAAEETFLAQVQAASTTLQSTAGAMLSSAGAIMVMPIVGAIIAGPMIAAAGAGIIAAATTLSAGALSFSAQYQTYLSVVSKTK